MTRLPFDPSKMKQSASTPTPQTDQTTPANKPWTVTRLCEHINAALRDGLPPTVAVTGEISGLKRQTHAYFTLKDAESVVSCVMFAPKLKRAPEFNDGQRVIATGRVEHWARGGRTQLYIDTIQPVGAGDLEAELRKRVERARSLGYLDEQRKRPLPTIPRRIAIITSRTSAALQDVLDTTRRRWPAAEIITIDVRVQGDDAVPQITAALNTIARNHTELAIDTVILTRGGGSIEDLWAFNEWPVAEAIVKSPVPIVAAIGHETDTTLAELVADLRAATPTQAAMRATPDGDALREQLDQLAARLRTALNRRAAAERRHLDAIARRPLFTDPAATSRAARTHLRHRARALLAAQREHAARYERRLARAAARLAAVRPERVYARRSARIEAAHHRLRRAIANRLALRRHATAADDLVNSAADHLARTADRLAALERELVLASPMHVLKRGYSVTRTPAGDILRSPNDASPGDAIETILADGTLHSRVTPPDATHIPPAPPPPPSTPHPVPARRPPARSRRRRRRDDADQMGLF